MLYIGDSSGKAKSTNAIYVGDSTGKSRRVVTIYQGDANGKAKIVYSSGVDWSPYFVYTAETVNNVKYALITEVNYSKWNADFGNYNIVIPDKIKGMPTMLKTS